MSLYEHVVNRNACEQFIECETITKEVGLIVKKNADSLKMTADTLKLMCLLIDWESECRRLGHWIIRSSLEV